MVFNGGFGVGTATDELGYFSVGVDPATLDQTPKEGFGILGCCTQRFQSFRCQFICCRIFVDFIIVVLLFVIVVLVGVILLFLLVIHLVFIVGVVFGGLQPAAAFCGMHE